MAIRLPFTILVLMLCAALRVHAQFDALPDSNATWTVTSWVGPGYPYLGFYYTYDAADPDTLYGTEVFKRLLMTPSINGQIYSAGYSGAIRDNGSGQVYLWQPGSQDPDLLYDFDVLPGDTVPAVVPFFGITGMVVADVDTVTLNAIPRKRIAVFPIGGDPSASGHWIQGVGGDGGFMGTCGCLSVSGLSWLVCMTANDTVQYGANEGSEGDCSILLATPAPVKEERGLALSPVPADDQLSLGIALDGEALVAVFTLDGRAVLRERIRRTTLSIGALPPGGYVLQLTDAAGRTQRARFIKR